MGRLKSISTNRNRTLEQRLGFVELSLPAVELGQSFGGAGRIGMIPAGRLLMERERPAKESLGFRIVPQIRGEYSKRGDERGINRIILFRPRFQGPLEDGNCPPYQR